MAVSSVKALINGQEYILNYNSSTGKYEAVITAPATSSYNVNTGHYYTVSVTATDDAGNSTTINDQDETFGTYMRLRVVEKVPPVLTITYPTSGAAITSNLPTFIWTVTDNDSGVDPDTIGITIDSGSKITGSSITKTAITGGYTCSYTPSSILSDGSHTFSVSASDHDRNNAASSDVTFSIDTVPPSLIVTSPVDGLVTNVTTLVVSGVTNDSSESPVTLTVKLNSGSAEAVTVESDGSFTKVLTLVQGQNTITVVSTDAAGQSTTVVRTVTLNQYAPVFESVTIYPNPVDAGATYIISVEVTDV